MITWISARKIHELYLEAIKECSPESYNKNAVKPFNELTKDQQKIDYYIVDKINWFINQIMRAEK